MSRIGKQPITIPAGVVVTLSDKQVSVKGPKGELHRNLHPMITISQKDDMLTVTPQDDSSLAQALWGTYASHIINMITGVTDGYEKQLVVEGVGFKADVKGSNLEMSLGFSHPISVTIPENLTVASEKNVITIQGFDKERVGQFAAKVRAFKKPEPYKGKGIRYSNEIIRRKEGKKTV